MEFEGKNVDQAVFRAAQELGRAPEDLEYVVLRRGPEGVRIRVEARAAGGPDGAPACAPAVHASSSLHSPAADSSTGRRRAGGARFPPEARTGAADRRERPRQDGRERFPARDERPSPSGRPAPSKHDDAEPPSNREPIYPDLHTMACALVRAAGLDLTLHVEADGDTERLRIEGTDAELLTGEGGETLSALEHLLNKMALRGLAKRGRIRLDSAGYRRRRDEDLVKMALQLAEQAKREGGELTTSPLNPYERRVVHMALRDDPGIETQSVGGGFLKKVMIRTHPGGGRPA
jgi:spoIIIJ-associated protein